MVVTASSRQLQGEQTASTDRTGTYRISQLPAGTYSLRFERESYRGFLRGGVGLDADQTLRLNVELLPVAVTITAQQVIVTGKPPIIDVGTTQTGLTMSGTLSQSLPMSPAAASNGGIRSFAGLAVAAPQVAFDLFGISIAGATSPENAYLIDGLSFSDTGFGVSNKNSFVGAGGTAGSDFSVEFVDQLNVITGGYLPEYGRSTGGVLSITTKSGGNEFHGSVFATWTPGFLAQTGQSVNNTNSILSSAGRLANAFDVGFTLGGYIVKDKLWFFVGFDPSQYRSERIRTLNVFTLDAGGNPIPNGNGFEQMAVPGATRTYFQTQTNYSYMAKLTYLINSDNRISLSVAGTPDSYTAPYALGADGDLSATSYAGSDNTIDMVLRFNSSFLQKTLLLDVTAGWHHQTNKATAIDGTSFGQGGDAAIPDVFFLAQPLNINQFPEDPAAGALPSICANMKTSANGSTYGDNACNVGGYNQGGPALALRNITEDRVQAKAVLTYFLDMLGHQTLKAGVDVEWISYENKVGFAGEDALWGFTDPNNPNGIYFDLHNIGYLKGPDNPVFLPFQDQHPTAVLPSAFIQDSWNVFDRVTVNIGVRFDAEYMYNESGALVLALNNQWAPRIGVIWDPTYQGKSKIYASYAFYYEAVPLDLADKSLIGNESIFAFHFNCPNPAITGKLCSNSAASLGGGGAGPNQYWGTLGADKELIDPNIGPQKTDEFQVGADYEVFPNARLGVNYTHRGLSRLIEDFSNNSASTYVLGNPGQGSATNFVRPARIYNGYTIALTKAFADHWQAQASYTFITLNGNVDGLYTPYQGQLDPNINATYDLPQFLVNGYGPLAADIQSRIKFAGSYQFIFTPTLGLTFGGVYSGSSGAPISALGGDLVYGGNVVFIIPRGSYGRLPWVHQLDLHATVDISLGQAMQLQIGAEVFNVIGSQQVTAVDQSWVYPTQIAVAPNVNGSVASLQQLNDPNGKPLCTTTPCPSTFPPGTVSVLNTNFGHATAYQTPRSFRLLARFSF